MRTEGGGPSGVEVGDRPIPTRLRARRKRKMQLGALAGTIPASSIPDFTLPLTEEELRDWE